MTHFNQRFLIGDVRAFINAVKLQNSSSFQFSADHPEGWCGLKMIFAPSRNVAPAVVTKYIEDAVKLVEAFPDFILGFDLVGQGSIL